MATSKYAKQQIVAISKTEKGKKKTFFLQSFLKHFVFNFEFTQKTFHSTSLTVAQFFFSNKLKFFNKNLHSGLNLVRSCRFFFFRLETETKKDQIVQVAQSLVRSIRWREILDEFWWVTNHHLEPSNEFLSCKLGALMVYMRDWWERLKEISAKCFNEIGMVRKFLKVLSSPQNLKPIRNKKLKANILSQYIFDCAF